LDWLVAETAAKEFAPMLSPYGKLLPMAATNRLEAIDTVANLREVRRILMREQSPNGSDRLVVEFKLKHVRAEDIVEKLKELVGTATGRGRSADQMRMLLERMRRGGGDQERNQGQEQRRPAQREAEVHLVVNEQENSILANAPPDKLAVVRQAVQALDVPAVEGRRGSDAITRMKIYRTKAIDPDAMAEMIQELVAMGKLQSNTQVQSDDDSNTLIVYAVPADHLAIANLVSQVDEDGRDVRIISLRQLDIDYALQAVKLLLQGQSSGEGRRGRQADEGFRIEADVERNRLLLWATDDEYAEINSLLAKLGENLERTASLGRGNSVRVLNLPAQGADRTLDSLKEIWPNVRDNPLRIQGQRNSRVRDLRRQTESRGGVDLQDRTGSPTPREPSQQTVTTVTEKPSVPTRFAVARVPAGNREDDEQQPEENTAVEKGDEPDSANSDDASSSDTADTKGEGKNEGEPEPPPITITQSASGQLIVTSKDVEALNSLESLLGQLMPAQADYVVFRLKHASPFAVELTLRQIFSTDATQGRTDGRLPASSRSLLQFISDIDTGTLLVQGATAEQLTKIERLLELYDQPETLDGELERKTEIYEVRYSRANLVAEVVKEVFRDLLSSNDKVFTPERKEGDSPSRNLGYGANYSSKIPRFKGLLSLGVEENTNTLVVSAPVFLIGDVMKLIRDVDQTAASHSTKVVTLNGVSTESLREVLARMPGVTTSTTSRREASGNGGDSGGATASNRSGDSDRSSAGENREARSSSRLRSDSPRERRNFENRGSRR
jgi:type II secretory pathway component GspD/PulD (secretin)